MANAVLKLSNEEIEKIKKSYQAYIQSNVPQGGLFVAKLTGCTVTAYKSGKILFQGPAAEQESSRWSSEQNIVPKKNKDAKKRKQHAFLPPDHVSSMSIIGSDEVGTGDFFGPITVVAAFVSKAQIPLVKELGVKDSKLMKDPQIIEIAKSLIQTIPYSLMVLPNPKYNALQAKGMTQGKMKAMLHQQAIEKVLAKLSNVNEAEGVLIDQFCEPEIFFRHTGSKPSTKPPFYFDTKAEEIHLSVAAASIIARYAFLKKMDEISEQAGMTIPKGAGPIVDQAAAKIIMKHDLAFLNSLSKSHFANTQKAMKLVNQKRKG
ncbi:ribonuclease HIII [Pseudalkalibacillus berkeleyi]|uniref:Ribonuclease HIII n=1 Tax=Pseudalkalibacillus berkeleyi TaxID=1069813 RepID=A0ABS9H2W5_9BACL|nr:ribonuclease HIII [Pseudalkalibacillus berkeleyi]MCF6138170.1 ribonuclease HIII [Pseudalkalibacillus berkeleyi]